ncbi:hypothetical protein [Endozoicomonas atrinae]|uniref:hypothetical protein n=1 Tax=Endozoicomonas atrinae TaxID=1333660 RepID=UPI001586E73A|nr:hypothetical protein [Endozoicomonas atrinae]
MSPIFQVEPFTGSTINSPTRWYQFDDRGISGVINISVTHENASRAANVVASAGGAITLDYSATKNSDNKESQ